MGGISETDRCQCPGLCINLQSRCCPQPIAGKETFGLIVWDWDNLIVVAAIAQVASHLIAGLSQAVDGCASACAAPFGSASVGPPSRVAIAKAAYTVSPLSCQAFPDAGRCLAAPSVAKP